MIIIKVYTYNYIHAMYLIYRHSPSPPSSPSVSNPDRVVLVECEGPGRQTCDSTEVYL